MPISPTVKMIWRKILCRKKTSNFTKTWTSYEYTKVIQKIPHTGGTGPQFLPKLGTKLKVKMKAIHMRKRGPKVIFSPKLVLKQVSPLVCDLPCLLFLFFIKSSLVRLISSNSYELMIPSLVKGHPVTITSGYTQIWDETGDFGSN